MTTTSLLRTLALAASLCLVVPCPTAHAQLGANAGFVEAFQPDFINRDLVLFRNYLELEDWQQPTVESLLNDYSDDFRLGTEGLKDKMKSMKDQILAAGDKGAMAVILGPINAWSAEKRKLRERFIDNVKAILSDEQAARWPRLERAMRREKELPRGVLSGENLDLVLIAREAEVPKEVLDKVAAAQIEAYELALDAALLARTEQMAASQEKIKDSIASGDSTAGLRELEFIVAKRVALRDLQEQHMALLADAFGAPYGAAFHERALREAFPAVYRPSPMIPYFAAARDLPGLTPDQTNQLNSLEGEYVTWYAQWQKDFAQVYRTSEPKKQTEVARMRAEQGQANVVKPTDPYKPMLETRDRHDQEIRDRICEIVGKELCEQLPGAAKLAAAAHRPMSGAAKPGMDSPTLAPDGGVAEPRGRTRGESRAVPTAPGTRGSGKDAPKSAE